MFSRMSFGMRTAMQKPQGSCETFNGLRGICAPLIVLHHALALVGIADPLPSGYYTISIFGGISGYVLATAYGPRFDAGLGPREFMGRRLQRLYPSVLAAHVLSLVDLPGGDFARFLAVPLGVFLLPNPLSTELYPLNPPLWWLLFDLMANVMLAVLWRRLSAATLMLLIGAAAVTSLALELHTGTQDGGHDWASFFMGYGRIVCAFFIGVALARLPFKAPKLSPWLLLAALIGICAIHPVGAMQPVLDVAVTLGFVPLLLWFAASSQAKGWTARLFQFLGGISFALYLVHVPVLNAAKHVLYRLHEPMTLPIVIGLFPLMLGLAWAFHHYFEMPVARRLAGRRTPAAPAAAPIGTARPAAAQQPLAPLHGLWSR